MASDSWGWADRHVSLHCTQLCTHKQYSVTERPENAYSFHITHAFSFHLIWFCKRAVVLICIFVHVQMITAYCLVALKDKFFRKRVSTYHCPCTFWQMPVRTFAICCQTLRIVKKRWRQTISDDDLNVKICYFLVLLVKPYSFVYLTWHTFCRLEKWRRTRITTQMPDKQSKYRINYQTERRASRDEVDT